MSGEEARFEVFPWSGNFETGIEKIDEQHRRLVDLINALAICTTREPTDEELRGILDQLIDYTDYHFGYEEGVWRSCLEADPSYAEHQETHRAFLLKVADLKERLRPSSTRKVMDDALQFLINWLIFHILDTDKKMAITVHLLESGSSLAEAKLQAEREVNDSRVLTNTIVNMYNVLTIRSLHLLNEREAIKRLTAKLEESERREKNFSDTLINSVPGLLCVLDQRLRFMRWNRSFHQLLGYDDEQLRGMRLDGLVAEENRPLLAQELAKVKEFGNAQFELEVIRRDGSVVPYLCSGYQGSDGNEPFYTFVGIDATPLKAVERELLHSQRLFEEAQRVANLGHWQLDHLTEELCWSDQIYRIFEMEQDGFEPSYEGFLERVHPDDRGTVDAMFRASIEGRRPYEAIHRLQMADGRVKYVKETGKTEYDLSGRPLYTIGNVQDVTKDIEAEQALERKSDEVKRALMSTVSGVARALEARDPYTAGHQQRVAQISVKIAEQMGLDEFRIEGIQLGASIHDLGKISVPAELLTKPVKLSNAEFMVIQSHAEAGYAILQETHFPWPIQEIIAQHHEREDGSGYPKGLKGDEICLEAKIVAVADVFEAMSTNRPYRTAPGTEMAIAELRQNRGRLYDAAVVDALTALHAAGGIEL